VNVNVYQGIQMLISKMAIGFLFTNPLAYTYALANGVSCSTSKAPPTRSFI
jgi:hypothetical protein